MQAPSALDQQANEKRQELGTSPELGAYSHQMSPRVMQAASPRQKRDDGFEIKIGGGSVGDDVLTRGGAANSVERAKRSGLTLLSDA